MTTTEVVLVQLKNFFLCLANRKVTAFLIGSVFKFCAKSLGGKIGLGVGVISGIIAGIANKSIGTLVSLVIIMPILLGIAGMIIEGIVRLVILIIKGIASLLGINKVR